MKGFLLDTNVISEYSSPLRSADERVTEWVDAQDEDQFHLSVLTFGEIRKGTALLPLGNRRRQLEKWMDAELRSRFANRLLPINERIAELWGAMAAQAQQRGISLPIIDGLMAATALHHDLTVVTRNVKDFAIWDVPVSDPWNWRR